MEYLYLAYIFLCSFLVFLQGFSLLSNMKQKYCQNNSLFPLLNLQFSILALGLGSITSLLTCYLSVFIVQISTSSFCVWIYFTMFTSRSNTRIIWKSAKIIMSLIGYLIPILVGAILYIFLDLHDHSFKTHFCLISSQNTKTYYIVLSILAFPVFQTIMLVLVIFEAIQGLSYIQRSRKKYPFLQSVYYEQIILPWIILFLMLPYSFVTNLNYIFENFVNLPIITQCSQLSLIVGALLTSILYGFNPSIQKITFIRNLYHFRTELETQYKTKLMEGSGTNIQIIQQMIPLDSHEPMSFQDLRKVMFPLGFITYGGPMAHINILKDRFKDYTTEDEFQELFALCQTLPGPTSTQMVIAVGTNLTHSCLGGLIAFLYFSVPSAIFMLMCGLYLPEIQLNWLQYLMDGFKYAAIAVILDAAYKLSNGAIKNQFHMFLWGGSVILSFIFPTSSTTISLIILGALLNFLNERRAAQPLIQPKEIVQDHHFESWLLGRRSLIGYAISFVIFFILSYIKFMPITVSAGLFKVGSLVIGGGHVVLPMIQMELIDYLTVEQFWNAFALVSCMPGPMFNIAIYIGALIGGLPIAILAEICMFLPGFFTIFGLLPYWRQYRSLRSVKSMLQGIAAVTVGFIISAVLHLIIQSCQKQILIPMGIAIMSCVGVYFKGPIPIIVLGGGLINLLIQHGQSIYQCLRMISGMHEYGLSALGKYQTYNLAQKTEPQFDVAFISDTRRTIETFEIIRMAGKTPPPERCIFTPLIREKFQGLYTLQDFSLFPDNPLNRTFRPPEGGESWDDVQVRVQQMLDFILQRFLFNRKSDGNEIDDVKRLLEQTEFNPDNNKCTNILLVTHYGFIKELVFIVKKHLEQITIENPYFAQNASLFTLQIIRTGEKEWDCKIISLNSYTKQYRPFM